MNSAKAIVGLSLLLCFSSAGFAQNEPCTSDARFSAFDFWVGDWDVYANGNPVGSNSIVKHEAGCLLLESWEGAGGSTGMSLNYFNPVSGFWQQVWVSAGEYAIDISGGLVNESMVRRALCAQRYRQYFINESAGDFSALYGNDAAHACGVGLYVQ